jgi:hypothetical protein
MNAYPNLVASDLLPGDVCMMMSVGELSKLISWVGDSPYSHAFLIYDQQQLVEAALAGIRLYPIAARLADKNEVLMIDVYRPSTATGKPYGPNEVAAMQAKAMEYVGRPYARNALVEIALMSALRNVVPDSETMRWVLRIAMSHYLKDDPTQMVCSELVYRILQEAQANPAGQLRPTIISAFRSHAALPPINAKALIKELEGIFYPKPPVAAAQPGAAAAPATAAARPTPIAVPVPVPVAAGKAAYESNEPASAELADLADAIRAKHLPPQASAPVLIVPDPNPKTVFPVDLATSPSLRFIGRMQL